jgi:ketosteroid isomerase-like protein
MTDNVPEIVSRYLQAADDKDSAGCGACFTADGTVLDEGVTYTGPDAIVAWRESTLAKWTYTTTVTGSEPISAAEYRVTVHVVGDFPGGEVDLKYGFRLRDGLIEALRIVE